jgi:hypothetical protein
MTKQGNAAPGFIEMVRAHGPITLGTARAYAAGLPAAQQSHSCCACRKCVCPSNGCCCKGKCAALSLNCGIGGCLWYACFFCVCKDSAHPGAYSCSDMKGNTYNMVKVDAEKDTWALFSENVALSPSKGDNLAVQCYCE